MLVFSQNGEFLIFWPKFGEISQYFGSNIVGDVAESWVEAKMIWVEVGGRFSNTHKKYRKMIRNFSFDGSSFNSFI